MERARFVSQAQTYINTDETVKSLVGIDSTHPRYSAFLKGFEEMFSNDAIIGGMYDALKQAGLLKNAPSRLVIDFTREWMLSMGRKGIQRLDTEDQAFLLAVRLVYFESMPTEQCGQKLKSEKVDGRQFYTWLAGAKTDTTVSRFLKLTSDAVVREVTKQQPPENVTEQQVEVAAELVGRRIAKQYGESKAKLVGAAVTDPTTVSDYEICIAARLIWTETLLLKGEPRRWMVRGLFM